MVSVHKPFEAQVELAVLDRQLIIRQPEIPLQPGQERRFKNPALTIERVARQPHQFRLAKAQAADVFQLRRQFFGANMSARRTDMVRFSSENDTGVLG